MAKISAATALGTIPGEIKQRALDRATTNISANYLHVVTKDTLEDQVSLSIGMSWFARLCGIHCVHPKDHFLQFPLLLGAKFFVISQLTIGMLEVSRRDRMPLATNLSSGATTARLAAQNWRNPPQIFD